MAVLSQLDGISTIKEEHKGTEGFFGGNNVSALLFGEYFVDQGGALQSLVGRSLKLLLPGLIGSKKKKKKSDPDKI